MERNQSNPSHTESQILYQDNHIIVANKPPRMATMGKKPGEPSLHDQVCHYLKHKFNKPGNVYLGIVSRLDALTGGVIVLAKTSKAARRLTAQFASGQVDKYYLAIVSGQLEPRRGRFVDFVRKNESLRRMIVTRQHDSKSKRAELRYQVLGSDQNATLVQVKPLTGRKHQIRLQFAHRGSPILGDHKYGCRRQFADGIALLAHSITLNHPVQKTSMNFTIDVPRSWKIARFGVKCEELVPWPD